jgi:hypothetical protein
MLRNKDGSVGVIFLVMQRDFSRVNNENLMFSHEHSSFLSALNWLRPKPVQIPLKSTQKR